MEILDYLFPYPGFGVIVSFSIIYGLCSVVIILGIILTRKLNFKSRTAIWLLIFIINSLIAAQFYPKQGGITVLEKIGHTYNVINNYESITEEDLELYIENEFDAFDISIPDVKERYIAALYKFRNEINRDGICFIYGDRDKPILENTSIEKHFETGQDKLIWWLLETFK
ncbi:hypothetical protein [Algoriphagus sp. NG3]|uniref:hypothetical protein n=1 Tax=Algoriphagus sp. NG3 TaxID=3097546 RepID=UPI002A83235A|nr:hypothetical protein [Algoriphagus sp. NG3]WPR76200.1 hypothetical protein SLW71_02425 [Algoriphagus sp. NG3]